MPIWDAFAYLAWIVEAKSDQSTIKAFVIDISNGQKLEQTQGVLYCLQHKSYFIDTISQEWNKITHRMVKFHWNGG